MNIAKYIVLPIYFFVVAIFVIYFDLGYTISLLLYFFVPSIYFSLKNPHAVKKALFYSLIFGVSAAFIFDYMAHVSSAWYTPSELGIYVLGAFPLEEIVWAFLYYYIMVISYETLFVTEKQNALFTRYSGYLIGFIVVCVAIFSALFFINKELLVLNYFYAFLVSIVMALPSVIILSFNPQHIKKIASLSVIFIVCALIYEYSALATGQWFFPSEHYIGFVPLLNFEIPLEELLFIILSVPGTISVYELFTRTPLSLTIKDS